MPDRRAGATEFFTTSHARHPELRISTLPVTVEFGFNLQRADRQAAKISDSVAQLTAKRS